MSKHTNKAILALAVCCCAVMAGCSFPGGSDIGETSGLSSQEKAVEAAVVDPFSLDQAVITLKEEAYTFEGQAVVPEEGLTVTVGDKTLEKGKDYTLTFENNEAPGVGAVIAEGAGEYTGKARLEFPIKPPVEEISSIEAGNGITGLRVNFAPAEKCDGYQVLYSTAEDFAEYHTAAADDPKADHIDITESVAAGQVYYVKLRSYVKFDENVYGNFCDPKSEKALGSIGKLTVKEPTVQYTGTMPQLDVTVTDTNGNPLKENDDFTLSIPEIDGMGTYTVTATGKGNYSGTAEAQILLSAGDLGEAKLVGLLDKYYCSDEGPSEDVKPAVSVVFRDETLTAGEDYELSYLTDDNGYASIVASGAGNYSGTASQTFQPIKGEWKTEGGLKSFVVDGAKLKGKAAIDGATYYFDDDGVMQTGWQKIGDDFYCFDRLSGQLVSGTRINKVNVDGEGKAVNLTTYQKQRIGVMMHAHQIMLEQTEPTDSMEEKRLKLFKWEIYEHSYKQWRLLSNLYQINDEWDVPFANDIFNQGTGCCVSDSCAVAFLFVEIGYQHVRVCHDTGHSWVMIDDKVFDPVFAEARDFDANFNSTPDDYRYTPPYWIDMEEDE